MDGLIRCFDKHVVQVGGIAANADAINDCRRCIDEMEKLIDVALMHCGNWHDLNFI